MKFVPGLLPRKATDRRFLAAPLSTTETLVPALVDLRPQLLPTSDQGNTPKCAAYSMAGWLEFYNWKYKGIAAQIDPDPIYAGAKKLDGEPNEPGTTYEAVIQAAQDLRLLTDINSIRYVGPNVLQQALHRYGVVLVALNITESWLDASPSGWISEGGVSLGGHGVLLCGYSAVDNPPWYGIQNSWGERHGWRGFNRLTFSTFRQQYYYGLILDFMA